jgi:cell division protein FtsN
MADEARTYLQKLSASGGKTGEHGRTPSYSQPKQVEEIYSTEGKRQKTNGSLSSSPSPQPVSPAQKNDPGEVQSIPVQPEVPVTPQVSAPEEAAPVPGRTPEGAQSQSRKYIVQVGSFVDNEKAEEVRNNLAAKGYSAVVKEVKQRGLGKVFVIQLQPVNSISKATTLTTQLSGEMEGEPVIIEVPGK